jgi:hypothetical protein
VTRTLFFLVALAVTFSGCSGSADRVAAEQAVSSFHERLNAGQFAEIYGLSSDELKKASMQSDFVALLDSVHRKLGNSKAAVDQAWNVTYHTSGTFITLTYKTIYGEGEAAEQFVFRMQGDSATLAGYHISANALVVKKLSDLRPERADRRH